MRYLFGGLLAVFLILVLVFAVQNTALVDIKFLAWTLSLPKALVIVSSYLLGAASGYGLFQFIRLAIQKI
jgi:uncharacterized integral membrane protein